MLNKSDLVWLLESGDLKRVKEVIKNNPNLDELAADSYLLGAAVLSKNVELVSYVIDLGINVNLEANEDGWTSILIAATVGDFEIFKLLVDSGADVNFISDQGDTCVDLAASNGFREIVDYLCAHPRFDPETDESDAQEVLKKTEEITENNYYDEKTSEIIIAIHARDLKKLRKLLDSGIRLNAIDERGITPLGAAVGTGNLEIIHFLIDAGADPNLAQPLRFAVGHKNNEVMSALLDAGARINDKDSKGMTVLMVAAMLTPYLIDPSIIVKFLLQKGADANARDNIGLSAIDHAIRAGNGQHFRLMKLLKEAGAEGIE